MGFTEAVISWYTAHINYVSITMLMALESSFIPFPSEVVIPPAAWKAMNGDLNLTLVVVFGTLGALLGALVNYYLSKWIGRIIIYKFADSRFGHMCLLDSSKVQKAEDHFVRYGNISTLLGRLIPAIRQLISIPAGLARMPLGRFCLFTTLGALVWNIVLALLGVLLHSKQELLQKYYSELSIIIVALAGLFILYLIYKGLKKSGK